MQINPNIYRGYDLRGVSNVDLSPEVYYQLGRGYATFLTQRRIFLCPVGCDNRLTSEEYKNSFIKGLNDGGIDTIDLGLSMSQVVYFSSYEYLTKGGAMITASHNPKEYNGLKLSVGYSDTMVTEEIQELRKIVEGGFFSKGSGKNTQKDIFPIYLSEITKYFNLTKKWKIVVDGCSTGSGVFYPQILRKAGCEVIEQNCKPDGNYPLGNPDPTETEVLERLAQTVKEKNADIGFAYDADGDRMAVVDNTGQVLWMDTIVALFAQDVLDFIPKASIVYNNLCSKVVPEIIIKMGGEPVVSKTGHSFVKSRIKEVRSPFGGELSGHIFFMDNFFGHDDAAYASLRLLSYLERKDETLNQAVEKLPKYFSSPEIKLGLADNIKFQFISDTIKHELIKLLPQGSINEVDGVRIDTEEAMVVVRASQNGPYITTKFEGKTQKKYNELKTSIANIFHKYSEIDWSSGSNISALS
ncbi:MAG TPA: phosphomannomutase/phosphoglucomutase [Spirochaetia bacterium]|nr:phosphomannomutase/phosphoglucomutase [Spirochaetia bacterium]